MKDKEYAQHWGEPTVWPFAVRVKTPASAYQEMCTRCGSAVGLLCTADGAALPDGVLHVERLNAQRTATAKGWAGWIVALLFITPVLFAIGPVWGWIFVTIMVLGVASAAVIAVRS